MMDETKRIEEQATVPAPGLNANTEELAENRLRGNAYLALRNICCEFHQGVLTLRGRLPTYFLKQVAQETVAGIENVESIDNQIEVLAQPSEASRR